MKPFFLVMSFLTRLPVPYVEYEESVYKKGIKYLPLIGIVIGLILYGVALAGKALGVSMAGMTPFFLTVLYILLTGGIHLDGVADTCDGIFSGRDRDGMFVIMKDSRIGTFGVISLIIWFLFYMTVIPAIPENWLLLMPVMGRNAMILSGYAAPYAKADGLGKMFIEGCRKTELTVALLVPFALALLLQEFYMLMACFICFISVLTITKSIQKKLGGITGDTLGFVCETAQIIFLAAGVILSDAIPLIFR